MTVGGRHVTQYFALIPVHYVGMVSWSPNHHGYRADSSSLVSSSYFCSGIFPRF